MKRTKRIDLRVTADTFNEVTKIAAEANISRTRLIDELIDHCFAYKDFFFYCCPDCDTVIKLKNEVSYGSGRELFVCKEGHANFYDFQQEDWIKNPDPENP